MNSTIAFPAPEPTLRLSRPASDKWATALTEERRRLLDDQEALREREQNLRDYETHLRALQEEIEIGRGPTWSTPSNSPLAVPARMASRTPFGDDTALQAAWHKLHRARELLEAEQAHVREDRHAIREQEAVLQRREAAVVLREAQLAEREARAAAPPPPAAEPLAGEPIAAEHTMSVVTCLSRGPFAIARSVFGGRK